MSALIPLLATKLRIPPTVAALIPRPHLLEKLNEGLRLGRRVTLVSAPPGYGKTTLLSNWAHHCQRAVTWLSLDEEDSDPARFLTYLVAALRQIEVVAEETELASLATLQPFSAQAVLPTLINDIETAGREFVLVLDDYHLIQASPVHDALTYLLDHQPPQVHLVIASRADPPLPLARLRARGQLAELRQSDLRFTPDETTAFLNQAMGLGLEAGDVGVLASRTEGWIAGLHLAATSLQARGDAHRFIQDFKGSNRYILDYLIEEVLQLQPQNVQAFLLQTSILDRLTGSLCDTVAERRGDPCGRPGQAMLEKLERANLFIVPLDDERKWYRYHRLFADLLQKRLGETYPELAPTLHRRASAWHEQNGLMAEAIDHALAAQDFERAAQLIERIAEATLMRSESTTLFKWLNALPEFSLFAVDRLGYGPERVGVILTVVGIVAVIGRGVLTGVFTKRWGEPRVIQGGLLAGTLAFLLLLLARTYLAVLFTAGLFVLITAFFRPAVHSLTSQRATVGQGAAMGLSNSFVSLGRVVGPLWAGAVFDLNANYPYVSGAVILFIVFLLSLLWMGTGKMNAAPVVSK